jgi:hypothetical protein
MEKESSGSALGRFMNFPLVKQGWNIDFNASSQMKFLIESTGNGSVISPRLQRPLHGNGPE